MYDNCIYKSQTYNLIFKKGSPAEIHRSIQVSTTQWRHLRNTLEVKVFVSELHLK